MTTLVEQRQAIVQRYRDAGQRWPATAREIAAWAIATKQWEPSHADLVERCADDLARAMREEFIIDDSGRRVRAKHAARLSAGQNQRTVWADIRTAPRAHMEVAFQQRRQQIVGDCRQLKFDVDSYNESRSSGEPPIQLCLDFTQDVAELDTCAA